MLNLNALINSCPITAPDSVIEQFNASTSTQPQEVGAEIVNLIEKTHAVSKATQGCYDLTIKPLFDLWGFKGESLIFPEPLALTQTLVASRFFKIRNCR
jgi:FAD:protein FMN transferase